MVSNLSPIGARAASAFSKASAFQLAGASPLPANNQHQRWTQTARGNARRGLSAPIYAADQHQFAVVSSHRRWRVFRKVPSLPIRGTRHIHLGIGRQAFAPHLSGQFTGANPILAQSLPHQHPVNLAVAVVHDQTRLPKCSLRPDHHGRSKKVWRYQISVMRCPK